MDTKEIVARTPVSDRQSDLTAAGSVVCFGFTHSFSLFALSAALVLFGVTMGLIPPLFSTMMANEFDENRGSAMGMFNFIRYTGMACGLFYQACYWECHLLFSFSAVSASSMPRPPFDDRDHAESSSDKDAARTKQKSCQVLKPGSFFNYRSVLHISSFTCLFSDTKANIVSVSPHMVISAPPVARYV